MKIVFLQDDFPPMSFGGAGISTFELALGMMRAGHDVSVITTCRRKDEAGAAGYLGLKVFKIASDYNPRWRAYVSIRNFPVVRQVEQLLKEINPDVVQVNNVHFYLSYHCIKLAKRYAKVVVFTARDVMAFNYGKLATKQYLERLDYRISWLDQVKQSKKRWNPFLYFFVRKYLRYTDSICAISNALKEALMVHGVDGVSVIYNGISVDEWTVTELAISEFKTKHGLHGKKTLFFSGRLNESKGGSKIISALPKILKSVPNAVLLVAGTVDEYAQRMMQEAKSLGIGNAIIFTGWIERDDIKVAYAVSDLVLMPSLCFDAFGRVNIEAMASKKPMISTQFGGSPEVVEDGVTGYIIDPRNPDSLAEKAIDLLKNPQKAEQFGKAGYERAVQKFNLKDKVMEYDMLYRSLLEKSL